MTAELRGEDVAVVGIAGRFPGAADVAEFWENLLGGVESVVAKSPDELRSAGVSEELIADPRYVPVLAAADDLTGFDARFFGYTPLDARIRDPQGRMFLETCHAALEDAGIDPARSPSVGVYGGSGGDWYGFENVRRNRAATDAAGPMAIAIANDPDYLASTVSYRLGLRGPSISVQTACSSSLVAVHLACQALRAGECQAAVAGGVNMELPAGHGYLALAGGIRARDGHCRPFDAEATGTVFASGVCAVALKRLDAALAAGDQIYGVIRGTAVNNDGAERAGFTAPGVEGQIRLVRAALAAARVRAEEIGYVEAHGTGTFVGDPIEVAALTEAFATSGSPRPRTCRIGSVKGNVGHLVAAAGVAGLIKVCLALRQEVLPPSGNFRRANPGLDLASGPFEINATATAWPRGGPARIAAVSSFGVGGTNAHLIIQEPPAAAAGEPRPARPWQILPVSAKTPTAAASAAARLADRLRAEPDLRLADVAGTLQDGRTAHPHRLAVVARRPRDGADALEARARRAERPARARSVAFMFPGQGNQYPAMGRGLYEGEALFRDIVDDGCAALARSGGPDLRPLLLGQDALPAGAHEAMQETATAQPALFLVSYGVARLLRAWGVEPEALIGQSVGEYVGACLAGVMAFEDALLLVAARGRLMQAMPRGAMLTVSAAEDDLLRLLPPDIEIAAVNADRQTVVSGPGPAIDRFGAELAARGVSCHRLHTSHAFHSKAMEPVLAPFRELVAKVPLRAPERAVVSNLTGDWLTAEQATDPGYWAEHLRRPVRLASGLALLGATEDLVLVEAGPGQSMSASARRIPGGADIPMVLTMRHPQDQAADDHALALEAAARLWALGVPLNWEAIRGGYPVRKIALPTYPFERRQYWVEPDPPLSDSAHIQDSTPGSGEAGTAAPIDRLVFRPTWRERPLPAHRTAIPTGSRWLFLAAESGVSRRLIDSVAAAGCEVAVAVCAAAGDQGRGAEGGFRLRPDQLPDYEDVLASSFGGRSPTHIVHAWLADGVAGSALSEDAVRAATDRGFHSLLCLLQALDRRASAEPVELFVLTDGMQEVAGTERTSPAKALVLGPVMVGEREVSALRCRSVDIALDEGGVTAVQAADLLGELCTAADDKQVAWRGRRRWVRTFERVRLDPVGDRPRPLRPGGTYLITGGLGSIGLAIAQSVAEDTGGNLVLVGRSPFPDRAAWEDLLASGGCDSGTAGRLEQLLRIEDAAAGLAVASCDVADEDALRAVLDDVESRFGPVNGVFHAAGVGGGGMLAVKTRREAEDVLRPKVLGTLALHRLLGHRVDFISLFSSIVAASGDFGLVDYCAANNFLDAYAKHAAQQGMAVQSVGWSGWSGGGMLTEAFAGTPLAQLRSLWESGEDPGSGPAASSRGLMERGLAIEAFRRTTDSVAEPHLILCVDDLNEYLRQAGSLTVDVVRRSKPGSATVPEHGEPGDAGSGISVVEEAIAGFLAECLGVGRVAVDDDFFELGGNSLVAVQVGARVRARFGVEIPLAVLFEESTVRNLAAVVEKQTAAGDR